MEIEKSQEEWQASIKLLSYAIFVKFVVILFGY